MSNFYYNKYYSRKGSDRRFYIPLPQYKVDLQKLSNEVFSEIKPYKAGDYGITTSLQHVNEDYDFKRYSGISHFNAEGERLLGSGERDEDIVYWPKKLANSYMKELADIFSDAIGIKNPRVRMSVNATISSHSDPHTPYRIHIALMTDPLILWHFREANGNMHSIHQPADGIPVLIETGITEHGVSIPHDKVNRKRIHLWYQFHDILSDEVLSKF